MALKHLIIPGLVFSVTAAAAAEEVVVTQQDKAFSAEQIRIKVGDQVVFVNDDTVTHNVYSRSKGSKFDSGAQAPGWSITQQFDVAGDIKVRCAIHPRMKLTVSVE
jgi:plastocyanin